MAAREARALWNVARAQGNAPARLVLCTDASRNHRRTAVALAHLWRGALGVETEVVEPEWNVCFGIVPGAQEKGREARAARPKWTGRSGGS